MLPEPHPDHLTDYARLKAIKTGGRKAIEDKAIAAYMKAYEEVGREEAEKQYFETFKNVSHGLDKRKCSTSGNQY